MNRRTMMKRSAESAAALVLARELGVPGELLAQYQPSGPVFDPRRYGARGDGNTVDTRALQQAIDACTQSGGGTVLLGPGTYVSGTITLKSNVTLQLQQGATILGSPNYADYVLPPEGVAALKGQQGQHLIFALGAQNVTLLGPGTIDGNGRHYIVPVQHAPPKPGDEYKDIAAFYTTRTVRISPMIQLANCTNLRIENITLQYSVGWTLNPVGCIKTVIRNVKVYNPVNTSNTDGIDPSSCQDMIIDNCDITAGDDALCVKSLNPYGGNQISKNIAVTNCRITSCTNGLKVGIEGQHSFENISFENCELYSVNGPLNATLACGICVNMADGYPIDGVSFKNIKMTNVRTPIYIRLQTTGGTLNLHKTQGIPLKGSLQNVSISGLRATGAILTSSITGLEGLPVRNITLSDVHIDTVEPGQLAWIKPTVFENQTGGGPAMFGRLPCYGLYARHVQGLTLQNVTINSQVGDPRPMLTTDDVQRLTLQQVGGTASDPGQPFLDLKNTQSARITGSQAPAGTGIYARVSGTNSHDVQLQGNDLSQSKNPVMKTLETPPDAVGSVN